MKKDQKFLKKDWIAYKMVEALEIKENDFVIEIGGGYGIITKFLKTKTVVLEKDKKLYEYLVSKFKNRIENGDFLILNEDFLKFQLPSFEYKIIGNIPYSISGKIIRKIFTPENHPTIAVFTFPEELGEKILNDYPKGNFLSYFIRTLATPQKILFIDKKLFKPIPKVNSIVIKFKFDKNLFNKFSNFNFYHFIKFLRTCFLFPQKNIKNNLKKILDIKIIEKALDENLLKKRAHEFTLEEIKNLYLKLKNYLNY